MRENNDKDKNLQKRNKAAKKYGNSSETNKEN